LIGTGSVCLGESDSIGFTKRWEKYGACCEIKKKDFLRASKGVFNAFPNLSNVEELNDEKDGQDAGKMRWTMFSLMVLTRQRHLFWALAVLSKRLLIQVYGFSSRADISQCNDSNWGVSEHLLCP
jgi:hypothetical protein